MPFKSEYNSNFDNILVKNLNLVFQYIFDSPITWLLSCVTQTQHYTATRSTSVNKERTESTISLPSIICSRNPSNESTLTFHLMAILLKTRNCVHSNWQSIENTSLHTHARARAHTHTHTHTHTLVFMVYGDFP